MAKSARVRGTPQTRTSSKSDATRLAALAEGHCPVRDIMHQAAAIQRARRRLERGMPADERLRELWTARTALTEMASFTRAQSLQGAYFQLALAMESLRVDLFENLTPELQAELLDHEQKAARLIASAASVIRQVIGDDAAAVAEETWVIDDELEDFERLTAA